MAVATLCAASCGSEAGAGAANPSSSSTVVTSTGTGTGTSSTSTPGTSTASTSTPGTSHASTASAGIAAGSQPARPAGARRRSSLVDPCPSRSSGALAQTERIPSARTACFRALVRALWDAVRTDSRHAGRYAFFPVRAYEQVKAIADPEGDYAVRLIPEYLLDLAAAHELLGSRAASARLVATIVPRRDIHWVPPGACYNRLGYYEVANSRLVYRLGGRLRSFGIASLISWRGTWYVVHLGAVKRSGIGGFVDDPSDGPGTPAPSTTC